jgi:Neutral/alkaline non-lysosomal ceramidase, N-terminal
MHRLQIGTGRSDITPAPGTPQGIWGAQTHERGVAADLPLYATALAITDGTQAALILDVDAIGFNAEWSARVLDAVQGLTGVPREHIRVAASHTHSGPKTQRLEVISQGLDMAVQYLESLPLRIAGAAWQAMSNLKPARLAAGSGACAINVNRRLTLPDGQVVIGPNADGPVDHTVRVVRFDDLNEKPLATIVHYACHPTIMAWDNQWFTPDYPGVVRQVVERELGGTCLFLQGATGSVGPILGFTGDRGVYRRLGTILGLEAAKVAIALDTLPRLRQFTGLMESGATIALYDEQPEATPEPVLRILSRVLRLPANRFSPVAELERELGSRRDDLERARRNGDRAEIRTATARATRALMRAQRAKVVEGKTHIDRQMQGIRIGPVALISIQDEPFVEIGQRIAAASPFAHTLFSGYSNGNFGYLPTREAFLEGGYEVSVSLYSPEAADIVVNEALAMLRELAAD